MKEVTCLCQKKLEFQQLPEHLFRNHWKNIIFTCGYCRLKFSSEQEYILHTIEFEHNSNLEFDYNVSDEGFFLFC